ncbi:MAG: hypothetical protein NVS4B11_05010 [Ktedonobacteraceae bacterium]
MTDCLDPMAPNDEELLRYALDGEPLSDEAKKHLDSCPICKQRVALYIGTNAFLTSNLYRSQCPSPITLTDYCAPMSLNILAGDERMHIADHASICPLCSAEIASMRRDLATTDLFPELEPTMFAKLLPFSPKATIRRLVATLQTQRPQLITRSSDTMNEAGSGTTSDTNWPKHYKADALDISLHLSRGSNGEIMLLGLFTSTDPKQSTEAFEDCVVDLYTASLAQIEQAAKNGCGVTPLLSTKVDDLGSIVFKAVPIGNYAMLVHLPDAELSIEGINIDHA